MPGYKAHLTTSAVLAACSLAGLVYTEAYQSDPMTLAALFCTAVAAALFPDVDTSSKGRQFFYGILAGVDIVLMVNEQYQWAAVVGFCAMLPALGNHRGWTHTWTAALLTPLFILCIPFVFCDFSWQTLLPYYLAALLGYSSHLVLDRFF